MRLISVPSIGSSGDSALSHDDCQGTRQDHVVGEASENDNSPLVYHTWVARTAARP